MKITIGPETRYFEEICHLVSEELGDDSLKRPFREIVGTFTGETIRTVIGHSDKFVILKAEVEGKLVGTVTVRVRTNEYFVMYLVVSKRFRKMGVATALMKHVFGRFPGRVTRLSCMEDLKDMYTKFGFGEISKTLSGILIMERSGEILSRAVGGELPYTERFLNKASLATLDLDFYPETEFHGRYNMIHAVDTYKIIKSAEWRSQTGVGILQSGAKTYHTAGNCISQNIIWPLLDNDGYKADISVRVFVSASGVEWIRGETFRRRCLDPFDKTRVSFSNISRTTPWERIDADEDTTRDIETIIKTLFEKVYNKLFGTDYSKSQCIDLLMTYDDSKKLWLLGCSS